MDQSNTDLIDASRNSLQRWLSKNQQQQQQQDDNDDYNNNDFDNEDKENNHMRINDPPSIAHSTPMQEEAFPFQDQVLVFENKIKWKEEQHNLSPLKKVTSVDRLIVHKVFCE
jgi:hypothetical protein